MSELKENVVFVEGQKDRMALATIGINKVLTVSGNLRASCELVKNTKKVIVLTDLDRRGNELARLSREELERYGINANLEYRILLGRIMKFKHFEEIGRKYIEFLEEIKNIN